MVSLAGSPHTSDGHELIIVLWTRCQPLREMLSVLLARRRLNHHDFDTLAELVAFVDPYRARADLCGILVMVGPDITRDHVRRLDDMFTDIASPTSLVVFEDAMLDAEQSRWSDARVSPSLHATVPPRMLEVLRIIDAMIEGKHEAAASSRASDPRGS